MILNNTQQLISLYDGMLHWPCSPPGPESDAAGAPERKTPPGRSLPGDAGYTCPTELPA